ncbi:HmuY family protein [Hyalangium rubrum]|uniref:HmuY family protein n=1 Tax=Hyalangium rubrum TaxID=3103134 RepID=A0ABU5HEH0_9BACT|nr:HmuY family protein [Hyalangium sp. s54d21]MDY7231875.1 HmuY family protein [Hyalangium sp. s54d21]
MSTRTEVRSMKRTAQAIWALSVMTMGPLVVGCGTDEPEPVQRCEASAVRCTEQSIDKLDLLTTVSTAEIREEGTAAGEFHTYVDARAGGSVPNQAYTYVSFTEQGLNRVSVDDQAALASTDWDIAFRRFIIRVNSGVSGPSCIAVARAPQGTSFESVTRVDSAWEFRSESYFNETCEFVEDDTGIGAPAAQMASYWSYQSCLAMTGNVFVLRLADGRHVKLQVTSYYEPSVQTVCNQSGSAPQPSGAAQFRVRWAFLP